MRSRKTFSILVIMLFMVLAGSFLLAQEQEKQPNVLAISTYKVRFDKVEEFLKQLEVYIPIIKQNDFIKSYRVFRHWWGPDWTVVILIEYENLAAIESSSKKGDELFEKNYPDKTKREEIEKKIQSLILGHTDAIVGEVLELRK